MPEGPPDPELLRTEFLGISVRHDDVALDGEALALLFAREAPHYELNRLELLPEGGALMSGPDGSELALRPGGATSGAVVRLGLRAGIERVTGLLAEAWRRFPPGRLWLEDVTLVASWDCERDEAARRLLAEEILRIDEERLAVLGADDVSVGLRLWCSLGDGTVDVFLEPMHADPSRLYLRLAYRQDDPLVDPSELVTALEALGAFLQGPLRAFVLAQARSSG